MSEASSPRPRRVINELPVPRKFAVTFVPRTTLSDPAFGLKLLTGVSRIIGDCIAKGKSNEQKALESKKVLESFDAQTRTTIYVGSKDLAQTISTSVASRLVAWLQANSRPATPLSNIFQIEVDYDK